MEAESRPKSLRITPETKRLNSLPQRLITPGSVRLGDRCDDWEQASHNGDLVHAVEAGVLGRKNVAQLLVATLTARVYV